jgi:8-oxo-dGTP diphosphatase
MLIKNTQINLTRGDIAQIKVDAIVNPVDNNLVMADKADSALSQKVEACLVNEDSVRSACRKALGKADELKISSIALPAIGCWGAGFPVTASAKIMAQEVLRHINQGKTGLKEIIFCLKSLEDYEVFEKNALGYLDYIVNKLKSPFLTVDAIIETGGGIVIIKRSNPPFGWALPGGFVDYGESLEQAVAREAKEETNLDITGVIQFHTYSDPERDPRFHTVGTVFIAQAKGEPKAGDDAAGLEIVKLDQIEAREFAFDHKKIIQDYIKFKKKGDDFHFLKRISY